MVPDVIRRYTSTSRVCPSRQARSCACWSDPGLQLGSKMTTRLAAVRLSPTPPALVEMRKTKIPLLRLNSSTSSWRSFVLPSRRRDEYPLSPQKCSRMSSRRVVVLNRSTLSFCLLQSSISASRTCILQQWSVADIWIPLCVWRTPPHSAASSPRASSATLMSFSSFFLSCSFGSALMRSMWLETLTRSEMHASMMQYGHFILPVWSWSWRW
mmetsp:Transcript_23801/g.77393  ORF Transcript_23801/g.77393 Transcript_23801/m.77393 type:complete len:212 (-) Transcript_23801:861-1496(-)